MKFDDFSFRRLFRRYKKTHVFTPGKTATLSFVDRNLKFYKIKDSIEQPGIQIVICGQSQTGKSTLIKNKLKELNLKYIYVSCTERDSFNDVISKTFDELEGFYNSEKNYERNLGFKLSPYKIIESIETTFKKDKKFERIVEAQLSPEKLFKILSSRKLIWVVEDAHLLSDQDLNTFSNFMKVFSDRTEDDDITKIILLGVVSSSEKLIKNNQHIKFRLDQIPIPFLEDEELRTIISKGEKLLNIEFSKKTINEIIRISKNRANVLHRLCLYCCNIAGINKSQVFKKHIGTEILDKAIFNYLVVFSDSYKIRFINALLNDKDSIEERFIKVAILDTLTFYDVHGSELSKIKDDIDKFSDFYQVSNFNKLFSLVENNIIDLTTDEYGSILAYNDKFKKYHFNTPTIAQYTSALLNINKDNLVGGKYFYLEVESVINRLQKDEHIT